MRGAFRVTDKNQVETDRLNLCQNQGSPNLIIRNQVETDTTKLVSKSGISKLDKDEIT